MIDKELFYNGSGCADPAAYNAIRKADHGRTVENVNRLIKEIKTLIKDNGFVLLNRIELKDEKKRHYFQVIPPHSEGAGG